MNERRTRSLVKAISWRFIASLTTIVWVFIFTKKLTLALEVGFFEMISKLIFYYFHERTWNKIKWGKKVI